jgi:SAM-dependent methyltransferase
MHQGPSSSVKAFYAARSETNWAKRYGSPYVLRRYASRTMWDLLVRAIDGSPVVADVGCGDGVLSTLLALHRPGRGVVAMDVSPESVRRAGDAAAAHGVRDRVRLVVADAECLPFKADSLPAVVSSHVLEHLPDFDLGIREIARVLRAGGVGVIALPTCLNPSAMVLLGGDRYWRLGRATPLALFKGMARVFLAWLRSDDGVQEGYAGRHEVPHVRRFPWRAIRQIERHRLDVTEWYADTLLVPYAAHVFPPLIRVQSWLDRALRHRRFWRNFGVGVIVRVRRRIS